MLYRFAAGGMAQVFLGRLTGEDGFESLVALKVIHEHLTDQPEFVKMFIDEARLVSRISHPNVAMTLELGRVNKTHFMAMEYVDGESLTALLRRTHPPMKYAARIIADAAAGLHAAHELRGPGGRLLNVVHRDVSPGNILISYNGTVKMIDFGVARARGSLHVTAGEVKGKFAYMSPEQLSAADMVDRRTDVFALGVVLHETTTWKRLFKAPTEGDTINSVLHKEITPPSQIIDDYPEALEKIVMRALERDPDKRFPTAQAMQQALERYLASTGEPLLSADVGEMMVSTFEDRIAEKQVLLDESGKDLETSVPDARPATDSSLVLTSVPSIFHDKRRKKNRKILAALSGVALLLVGALVAAYFVFFFPSAEDASGSRKTHLSTAGETPKDVVRTITIAAKVVPENASIIFGKRLMPNPFEIQEPAREAISKLIITAPGYKTKRLDVSLAKDGSWTITLDRELVVAKKATTPGLNPTATKPANAKKRRRPKWRRPKRRIRKHAWKKPRKTKKPDSQNGDFVDNPYR
ncbi:MAG: serine/threonine protein kinase [Deltaproteobacteria bacterium]|nr:serine/threonine protein kinase [Deltaproteobacteria bacterium]